MRLKDFLDLLANYADVKIFDTEANEEPLFVGKAHDCPYWIANQQVLEHGDEDGWFVDKEGYLNIYCKYSEQ